MPDKYGNSLKAGDRVLFTSVTYGSLQEGTMKYDEGEKVKLHIDIEYTYPDGRVVRTTKHFNKYRGNNDCILNIASYVKMQLDEGLVDLADA